MVLVFFRNASTGETFSVDVDTDNDTVTSLKEKLVLKLGQGISTEYIELTFLGGSLTTDGRNLREIGISDESLIDLCIGKPPRFFCPCCKTPLIGQHLKSVTFLQCGHPICETCLFDSSTPENSDSALLEYSCAICAERSIYYSNQDQRLTDTPGEQKFLQRLVEFFLEQDRRELDAQLFSTTPCALKCGLDAVRTCEECERSHCTECDQQLHSLPRLAAHRRHPIRSAPRKTSVCFDHDFARCTEYCLQDRCLVCPKCVAGTHSGHTMVVPAAAAQSIREGIADEMESLGKLKRLLQKLKGAAVLKCKKMQSSKTKELQGLQDVFHSLAVIMRSRHDALEAELVNSYFDQEIKLSSYLSSIGEWLAMIDTKEKFAEIAPTLEDVSVLESTQLLDLPIHSETLHHFINTSTPRLLQPLYSFVDLEELSSRINSFGAVVSQLDPPMGLMVENVTDTTVECRWDKPLADQDLLLEYSVEVESLRKEEASACISISSTTERKVVLKGLKPFEEYAVKVCASLESRLLSSSWSKPCRFRTQLRNAAGLNVSLGEDKKTFFCGKKVGTRALPGSDGRCGPTNGPHCLACKGLFLNANGRLVSIGKDGVTLCCGSRTQKPDVGASGETETICGPGEQCEDCVGMYVNKAFALMSKGKNSSLYCSRYLGSAIPGSDGFCGPVGSQCADCNGFFVNNARSLVQAGRDKFTMYCGRHVGVHRLPFSDGICGPNDGPQCSDCNGLRLNRIGDSISPGRDRRTMYCGQFIGFRLLDSDGYCGPTNGPQCANCVGLHL